MVDKAASRGFQRIHLGESWYQDLLSLLRAVIYAGLLLLRDQYVSFGVEIFNLFYVDLYIYFFLMLTNLKLTMTNVFRASKIESFTSFMICTISLVFFCEYAIYYLVLFQVRFFKLYVLFYLIQSNRFYRLKQSALIESTRTFGSLILSSKSWLKLL